MSAQKINVWLGLSLVLAACALEAQQDPHKAIQPLEQVHYTYHEERPAEDLARAGNNGMVAALDPYAQYLTREPTARFMVAARGEYAGIGCRIQEIYPDSAIGVSALVHADTPAGRAGVRPGDLILAIDDSTTHGMNTATAVALIKGEPGSQVRLLVKRAGKDKPFEIRVERGAVQLPSLRFKTLFDDGTGYIKLEALQSGSGQECRTVVNELMAAGMERLILDLRGNGGGLLKEAVAVADLFLPERHLVVSTVGRASADTVHFYTQEPSAIGDRALVILVDDRTASAAEIMAGAMQDWDRSLIVGLPTVGKGSVQETIAIGTKATLKLTTATYILPSGRSINKRMRRDSSLVETDEKMFKTRRLERIVHNRGGLEPDVLLEGREMTPLLQQLWGGAGDHTFFHFAPHYGLQLKDLTADFRADESTLKAFRKFIAERDFDYVSPVEIRYQQLEEAAEEEELKKLSKSLKKVKEGIDRIEEQHWRNDAALINWKLTYDILEKNLGMEAALSYETSVNPFIQRAREVIKDDQYGEWLAKGEIGEKDEEKTASQE